MFLYFLSNHRNPQINLQSRRLLSLKRSVRTDVIFRWWIFHLWGVGSTQISGKHSFCYKKLRSSNLKGTVTVIKTSVYWSRPKISFWPYLNPKLQQIFIWWISRFCNTFVYTRTVNGYLIMEKGRWRGKKRRSSLYKPITGKSSLTGQGGGV